MPVKITPAEHATLWKSRLDAAGDRIKTGVERVTTAPGIQAAAAADKFKARILEAIESGRWGNEVKRVTLEQWKSAMLTKGVPRIRAGTEAAVPEVQEFATALYAHIEVGQRALTPMPSVTLADNIDRMVSFVTHMSKFTFRGKT